MKRIISRTSILLCALTIGTAGSNALADQGVTKDEIVLGVLADLSGPIASVGKQVRNGIQMHAEEINESGGINGRKIKLVVEDSGYDPRKSLLAAQKMVQQSKFFALIGTVGSGPANASFQTIFEKNVPSIFPVAAAREMYEPLSPLKFAFITPYYDSVPSGVKWMAKERGAKKFCIMYQDDDFGLEVFRGAEQALKDMKLDFIEKTSYKRGATDFSAQMTKMKISGCDTVVLGTVIRETIGAMSTAKKLGWDPQFLASTAAYSELLPKLGGKTPDGLYATFQASVPYMDDASQNVRKWVERYKAKFNEDPGVYSEYGYMAVGLFSRAAANAGETLTTESLANAFETTTFPRDMFGNSEMKFSTTNHLGTKAARIGQIQNGKWVTISDFLEY